MSVLHIYAVISCKIFGNGNEIPKEDKANYERSTNGILNTNAIRLQSKKCWSK